MKHASLEQNAPSGPRCHIISLTDFLVKDFLNHFLVKDFLNLIVLILVKWGNSFF